MADHVNEHATLGDPNDGRRDPRSVAKAMTLLRTRCVKCAHAGCAHLAKFVGDGDELVCHAHYRKGRRLTVAEARKKLNALR
jgi:hypothetical protein